MKKPIPEFKSDEEAAEFVDTADLTEYDLSGFTPTQFVLQPKPARQDPIKPRVKATG